MKKTIKNPPANRRRNAKGQFIPKPDRDKKPEKLITLNEIERNLQKDLKSRTPSVRHKATALLLQVKKAQAGIVDDDTPRMLDPRIRKVLDVAMAGLLEVPGITEVDDPDTEAGG